LETLTIPKEEDIKTEKITYCKKCLMPNTRPRVSFDENGICNACNWAERKEKEINWDARWEELEELCDKYRIEDGSNWDVIVPASGGKDSYHVAYNMKYKLKMHPLLVRFSPLIPTEIGERNWQNLVDHGFDAIQIYPDRKVYGKLCKKTLIEQGRPWQPFESAITTAVLRIAIKFNIPFVMYGEEGESEYGGRMDMAEKADCKRKWIVDTYFSGVDTDTYVKDYGLSRDQVKWWELPTQKQLDDLGIFYVHWSYFENWDHLYHYEIAKKLGFKPVSKVDGTDSVYGYGTYTDYTCLDDISRTLNTYFMFLKFGFGRGTQEATGDIRAGLMDRDEGIRLAKQYDNYDCIHFRDQILDFFQMTQEEWDQVVDKWANRDILKKEHGIWMLKEPIE